MYWPSPVAAWWWSAVKTAAAPAVPPSGSLMAWNVSVG
jgi:hypothetical protein